MTSPFAPQSWKEYFSSCRFVHIPEREIHFRVFESGEAASGKPLIVLHHGGGHSALSWAVCVKTLRKKTGDRFPVMAFDCRGHGKTRSGDDLDLSLNTLSLDLAELLKALYLQKGLTPNIFLFGHSMGGAVVVQCASQKLVRLTGLGVLDVVEGTALDALEGSAMLHFLRRRPPVFASLTEAIQWSISSDTVRNIESAKVSIPPQLKRIQNPFKAGAPASQEPELSVDDVSTDDLMNEGERVHGREYTWRTDLFASEKFWREWYTGMSAKFLSSPAAKILILAGTDRLDKDLTIGQMQGKFQMKVLPACGHIVQEDAPEKVAEVIHDFVERNMPLDISAIRARNPPPPLAK